MIRTEDANGSALPLPKERGSALAISLMILTSITLLAVSAMERSGLQARMVRNVQHSERLFHTALSDQELWFALIISDESGDSLLAKPLSNFELDENNQRQYLPVELESVIEEPQYIDLTRNLLHVPPSKGQLSLSEGNEVNSRIDYDFQLNSEAGIGSRSLVAKQRTGLTFPGLNNQQNSLF